MFLSRMRRKLTFKELGFLFGVGEETARRNVNELMDVFSKFLVYRLVYPLPPAEIRKMIDPEVLAKFPDLLAVLDATNWHIEKALNFLKNRMSYSNYKHDNVFQVLLGEWSD